MDAPRTIELTDEQAEAIDRLVAEGRIGSVSEVVDLALARVEDGVEDDGSETILREAAERDLGRPIDAPVMTRAEVDDWLQSQVAPVVDRIDRDRSGMMSIDETFEGIRRRMVERDATARRGSRGGT